MGTVSARCSAALNQHACSDAVPTKGGAAIKYAIGDAVAAAMTRQESALPVGHAVETAAGSAIV